MSKKIIALVAISIALVAAIPTTIGLAQAYIISSTTIEKQQRDDNYHARRFAESMPRRINKMQRQFSSICDRCSPVKNYGDPQLFVIQQQGCRPCERRKLMHERLNKTKDVLGQLEEKNQEKALINLKHRIQNLQKINKGKIE